MRSTDSNALECAPFEDRFNPRHDDFEPKARQYIHFDLPLSDEEREAFQKSPSGLVRHSFWPLLGFVKKHRRVKPGDPDGIKIETKEREIKFASHTDAAVLEYYAKYLTPYYEQKIIDWDISHCVLAYRSGVGDNIKQSKVAFEEIKSRKTCIAIAMDISGFFDNIRHSVLKEEIKTILKVESLSSHDYHLFKNLTKYSWIEEEQIEERLKGKKTPNGRICSAYQLRKYFREKKPSIIHRNNENSGIPQGTPISGLYANISMLSFDKWAYNYLCSIGGSYRRYSDDIAILVPDETDTKSLILTFTEKLQDVGLSINAYKTDVSHFIYNGSSQIADKKFQYLGFTYDGSKILIRSSSLNNYFKKMRRGIYGKISVAKYKNIPKDQIYLRELYKKYTHYGKSRNFVRYAYRASKEMESGEIRRQLSNHMKKFRETLSEAVGKYYT